EAMAFGLPIIATDAGGVPEIIEPGVNGLLVKPEDSQNLAEAMVCLLKEPDLREKLGDGGKEIVARRFSLTQHFDELERHFVEAQDWVKGQKR
ncbi:MAG: glycosyltransferase family 4 protein, partial [bacterium]